VPDEGIIETIRELRLLRAKAIELTAQQEELRRLIEEAIAKAMLPDSDNSGEPRVK
jgi:hypothetical protein